MKVTTLIAALCFVIFIIAGKIHSKVESIEKQTAELDKAIAEYMATNKIEPIKLQAE